MLSVEVLARIPLAAHGHCGSGGCSSGAAGICVCELKALFELSPRLGVSSESEV